MNILFIDVSEIKECPFFISHWLILEVDIYTSLTLLYLVQISLKKNSDDNLIFFCFYL